MNAPAKDATTDPQRRSWLAAANVASCHFPIQNLPFGVFRPGREAPWRCGVAIGDAVLDLAALQAAGLLPMALAAGLFARDSLNAFIGQGRAAWRATRAALAALLDAGSPLVDPRLRDDAALRAAALHPLQSVELALPVQVPGYTDFYASREHAFNVGAMFRNPEQAILPNWFELPIGYNGRASSVVVSGTPVRRPLGQARPPLDAPGARPDFGPSRKLDFELETAAIVGRESALGQPVPLRDAEAHLFGMVLMNDWSARDIQQWEYVPLGPFNSKTFATSISPWVVTLDALEPFRVPGPAQEPRPLAYLRSDTPQAFDIALEVWLQPAGARQAQRISHGNARGLYWSMAQQLAHHTVSGCNLRVGDMLGSGTISGAEPGTQGSLLELTRNGQQPLQFEGGLVRAYLEDGDRLSLTGWAQGEGYRVGFGGVDGVVLPAPAFGN